MKCICCKIENVMNEAVKHPSKDSANTLDRIIREFNDASQDQVDLILSLLNCKSNHRETFSAWIDGINGQLSEAKLKITKKIWAKARNRCLTPMRRYE